MAARFDNELHPVVPAVYFAGALGLVMATFHPILVACALVSGVLYSAYLRGPQATAESLLWQLPLGLVMALINLLVGSQGSTPLFVLFGHTFMLEKLVYGLSMGGMLVAAIIWFSCAGRIMTMEKVTALLGRFAPVVGTTVAFVSRLVPQYARRAQEIRGTEAANTAGRTGQPDAGGLKARVTDASRWISVLVGWGMEDSLETADSMTARGWGSRARRTSYVRYRFSAVDAVALALVVLVFGLAAAGAVQAYAGFAFYPTPGPWTGAWWAYVAFGAYLLLPLMYEGGARLWWKRR